MLLLIIGLFFVNFTRIFGLGEIIYALNAGGESFTDGFGIRYRRDYLSDGIASDYGRMVDIKRVSSSEKPLYETERYSTETFGYTIPMPAGEGDYVLWLKFSEVWFNAPNLKVFDVTLNDVIVVKDLDIFDQVGRAVAHDEIIPFQVRQNKIIINGKGLPFNNEIRIEFVKGPHDNPKVNAIVVMKGTVDQVPKLPPFKPEKVLDEFDEEDETISRNQNEDSEDDENEEFNLEEKKRKMEQMRANQEEREEKVQRKKKNIQPTFTTDNVENPYESDEASYAIPFLVAIGALIPILFCFCRK